MTADKNATDMSSSTMNTNINNIIVSASNDSAITTANDVFESCILPSNSNTNAGFTSYSNDDGVFENKFLSLLFANKYEYMHPPTSILTDLEYKQRNNSCISSLHNFDIDNKNDVFNQRIDDKNDSIDFDEVRQKTSITKHDDAPATATRLQAPTTPTTVQRQRGDLRMKRAIIARLFNPSLALYEALSIGGFMYPPSHRNDPNITDDENITLGQRKNQLSRRLRLLREQKRKFGYDTKTEKPRSG